MELLKDGLAVCVTDAHKFGTDAFLLADFCNAKHKDRVVDLGTGCGIIPMLLYQKFAPAFLCGVDLQPQAIAQFEIGIAHCGLAGRMEAVQADFCALDGILPAGAWDLVCCNPPYKMPGSGLLNDEPARQIARHALNGDLSELCCSASRLLRFGGRFCICQRPQRLPDAIAAMRAHQLEPKRLRLVAKHADTAPWLFLLEGRKGGKPFLTIEPTLAVYEKDGSFTQAMQTIYGF